MDTRSEIIEFFNGMLAKKEFFIPLTAAQYQYPRHYYGLTSAALLEDLFVDAAINYQNTDRTDVRIERPDKGEKGWDYKFQEEHYSHKVGKDIGGIALLWDSTFVLPENKTYSYSSPMIFVLAQYKGKSGKFLGDDFTIDLTPVSHFRGKLLEQGQYVLICERKEGQNWIILNSKKVEGEDVELHDFLPFKDLWEKLVEYWNSGIGVNQIDIFVTKKRKDIKDNAFSEKSMVKIEFVALPGVYLFPKSELQNVEVEKNNRGVLLPKLKVLELVQKAYETKNFAFLPNWYTAYAGPRNVDLYQVQRAEYDSITTAAKR